jgi:methyl-accepting chemotaxis protein
MNKTKQNKRRRITKKTRKYKKYYGGNVELSNPESVKEDETEGVIDIIGDKLSGYTGRIINYGKEKGLRLLGLQTIKPNVESNVVAEDSQKIDESLNQATQGLSNATEGISKIGSDVVNVADKASAAVIQNINDVLQSPEVGKSVSEAAGDIAETGTKLLSEFNKVASTPEFKQQTKVAIDNAAEIAEIVIQAADKPITEAVDVLNEAGEKAVAGVASGAIKAATDVAAAVPFYGSIIDMGKMVNDVTAAAQDVVEASTSATEAVSKAVKETSDNINEGLEKLEAAKQKVDNLSSSMPQMPKIPQIPKIDGQNIQKQMVQAAGGLKKINNEKYQVAGRIIDSINEFKDPINFSIMKGGNKTKKHYVKSKGKSKRVRFNL